MGRRRPVWAMATDAAVAIATNGLLETHNAPSANSATALWYSAADLLAAAVATNPSRCGHPRRRRD